jgi:hypothetical protein
MSVGGAISRSARLVAGFLDWTSSVSTRVLCGEHLGVVHRCPSVLVTCGKRDNGISEEVRVEDSTYRGDDIYFGCRDDNKLM